MGVMVSNVKIV